MDKPQKFMGIPVSADITMVKTPARAKYPWPFKRIVVGPGFFILSDKEKKAVLAHEAGHCRLFHWEKRFLIVSLTFWIGLINADFWMRKIMRGQAFKHEFEADEFAARNNHAEGLSSSLKKGNEKNLSGERKWNMFFQRILSDLKKSYDEEMMIRKSAHPDAKERMRRLNGYDKKR